MGRGRLDAAGLPGLWPPAVTFLFSCTLVFAAVHWVATLNVGSGGAHASYYHRANEQVRLLTPSPNWQVSHELPPPHPLQGPADHCSCPYFAYIHFLHGGPLC